LVVGAPVHPGVQILTEESLVSCQDASDGRLLVEDLSRSHVVTRVTPPAGPPVVVKMPGPANLSIGRGLASELMVYRLAAWVDGVAAAVPTPVVIDEARQVLVLRGDEVRISLAELLWASPGELPWAAKALGAATGGWHRDTVGLAMAPPSPPFALELELRSEAALAVLGDEARVLARCLLADPDASGALRAVIAGWAAESVIHGDLKWDNCLVDDTEAAARRLRVIDWELAGFGDPAWDVGCALAEHYVAGALLPERLGPRREDAIALLLRAYADAAQMDRARLDAFPARVATATAARLVQCAVEHEDADARAGRPRRGDELAELACHVARERSGLAERWRRAL
jgi:Ser/Thr protein kinase RdoA (MazF antagonist)